MIESPEKIALKRVIAFAIDNDAERVEDCKRLAQQVAILRRLISDGDNRGQLIEMANESCISLPDHLEEMIENSDAARQLSNN